MPDAPLTDDEFSALMDRLGPFEARPHIAVAVSGGRDSLCLALLLRRWARRRRGRITALTVDHGLRPDSAAEARTVGRWLRAHKIGHGILPWDHSHQPQPGSGLQAAARQARYRLLCGRCRDLGILHLALAHQRDDQAETFLLRLGRGSGLDGLAGMAPVSERTGVRLLRPLIPVPRDRLAATLRAWGQDWIDDPTNENAAHTRIRLRRLLPFLAAAGVTPGRLAETAAALGQARASMDEAVAGILAAGAEIDPAGYLWLDPSALAGATAAVGRRVLARCLMAIGGGGFTPRSERLNRLYGQIAEARLAAGATLAGCQVRGKGGRLLIYRELAAAGPAIALTPGAAQIWDGRFAVTLARATGKTGPLQVAALGPEGYRAALKARPDLRERPIPAPARPVLPAVWADAGRGLELLAVPHLDYLAKSAQVSVVIEFVPPQSLAPSRFTVA
ncbi:MAG: tRNA lysidine(34) synthetase TilS [Dongiaceae bacterium]